MRNTLLRLSYLLIVLLLGAIYIFYFLDKGFAVECSFYKKTNLQCPGCGAQRALSSLVKGNIRQAWQFNPLIFMYISILGFLYVALMEVYVVKNKAFLAKYPIPSWSAYLFIGIMIVFFLYRNYTLLW